MSTAGALVYLQLTWIRGLVLSRLRRLRQPKYLAGAVVGAAYVYFFFLRRWGPAQAPHRLPQGGELTTQVISTLAPSVELAWGTVAFLLFLMMNWVFPKGAPSLMFSEAEIAFLFPAPLSRRTLVHYKLLRMLLALLFASALLSLLSNRWRFLGGGALIHVLGWWLILSTLSLHSTAASFTISRLTNRGIAPWVVHTGFLVGFLVLLRGVWALLPPFPGNADGFEAVGAYIASLLQNSALAWLLLIPRWVVGPFFASSWEGFALALPAALLVLGAHYGWVLLSVTSFEEASVVQAEKRAARLKARRAGRASGIAPVKARREPFPLTPEGWVPLAFLWKNLLSMPGFVAVRTILILAGVIVGGCLWMSQDPVYRAGLDHVAIWSLVLVGYALAFGPMLVRADLRADLMNADLLKTYPVSGPRIVLGEILVSVVILTSVVWLGLLAAGLSVWLEGKWAIPWGMGAMAGVAALAVPVLCALQLLTPNAFVLLFPAWHQSVISQGERGLDVMGQRLLFFFLQMLVTLLALVPAALFGAGVYLVTRILGLESVAPFATAVSVLGVLVLEVWLGIAWVGRLFERMDLSEELRG